MAHNEIPFDPNDPDAANAMRGFFNPSQVDQMVRQAMQFCWMALPPEKQNAAELQRQFRRIVDRALRDFHEDQEQFK